jgi:hypothetical protein
MKPHPKTLALVALATGMLVSAYMIGPAPASPAATSTPRAAPVASVASSTQASPTIKTLRPPVPLSVSAHKEFFTPPPADAAAATPMLDPTAKSPTSNDDATSPTEMAAAKSAIEMDGYRKVANLVKAPDGSWRGRALRGSTEIAVRVDATGSVAAD